MMPLRIQRMRTRGFKLPPNTVSVTRPGRWGNPYRCDGATDLTPADAVEHFRLWIGRNSYLQTLGRASLTPDAIRTHLRGKNLACFCKLCDLHKDGKPLNVRCADCAPCHADVLGELASGFVCEAAA